MERVTGIDPAVLAWELHDMGSTRAVDQRFRLTVISRERP